MERKGQDRRAANEEVLRWFTGNFRNAWREGGTDGIWFDRRNDGGGRRGWESPGWSDGVRSRWAKWRLWRKIRERWGNGVREN